MKRLVSVLLIVSILLTSCRLLGQNSNDLDTNNLSSSNNMVQERFDESTQSYYYSSDQVSEDQLFFRKADDDDIKEAIDSEGHNTQYVANELIVLAVLGQDYAQMVDLADQYELDVVGYIDMCDTYQMRTRKNKEWDDLEKLRKALLSEPSVEDVSINRVSELVTEAYELPNDPWHLSWLEGGGLNTKEPVSETEVGGNNWGVEAIQAPWFWKNYNLTHVKAGVFDNQFYEKHEDLNPVAVYNNDFSFKTSKFYHGIAVAGVIGATYNNKKGVSGLLIDPDLYEISYKDRTTLVSCLVMIGVFLINDVRVINCSWGYYPEDKVIAPYAAAAVSPYLLRFLNRGWDFIIVNAAGNSGDNPDYADARMNSWLSAITEPELKDRILVVGNAEFSDGIYRRAASSCYGERVDLMAPGTDILCCCCRIVWSTYKLTSGTSIAAPFVTAACAALWEYYPLLNGKEIAKIIKMTADIPVEDSNVGMLDLKAAFGGFAEDEIDHDHMNYNQILDAYKNNKAGENAETSEDGKWVIKKVVRYIGEDNLFWWADFEYDDKGNKTKEVYHDPDGTIAHWAEFEYDSNGYETKNISYGSDGRITLWYEHEYDSNGNELKYISYNTDGSISYWEEHEYDSNGHELKYISYYADGNIRLWTGHEYDSDGNEIKTVDYNTDGSIRSWVEYEYDNGNRIKTCSYNSKGDIIDCTESILDAHHNVIQIIITDSDGTSTVYCSIDIEYSFDGKVLKRTFYYSDGSVRKVEFDSAGKTIAHEYTDSSYSYSYYVGDGTSLERQIQYNSDGSISSWEEYRIDYADDLIAYTERQTGFDSDGSVLWMEDYEYDSYGNLIKDIEYDEDGGFSYFYEAVVDSYGNVIKDIWYNSDGSIWVWGENEYVFFPN